jgi:hypothetical protein
MDDVEKMDCRATDEVIFCVLSPPRSKSVKITKSISRRTGLTGKGKGVGYPIEEQRIVLTGIEKK